MVRLGLVYRVTDFCFQSISNLFRFITPCQYRTNLLFSLITRFLTPPNTKEPRASGSSFSDPARKRRDFFLYFKSVLMTSPID